MISRLELGHEWKLRGSYLHGEEIPARLPGDNYSALLAAGKIPEPYYGKNERLVLDVYKSDWQYSQDFDVPLELLDKKHVYLIVSAADTLCECTLNGQAVFSSENAFAIMREDVKKYLSAGTNHIVFKFLPVQPVLDARRKAAGNGHPYFVSDIDFGLNYLRKPICNGGWDWGLMLMVSGIYEPIRLIGVDETRVDSLYTKQKHEEHRVVVTAVAGVHAETACSENVTFSFNGENKTTLAHLEAGLNLVAVEFVVEQPKLWFPNGYGEQALYDLTVTTGDDTMTRRIGLRSLEVVNQHDAEGVSMTFRINGVDIFCKGANWIPCDAMPQRQTRERYDDLLESARIANMNMIRVWGGGQYERECFYELCDEKGILVWQDMMFSCGVYPSDDAFLAQVQLEVDYQIPRLRSHACLALICGDNECLGATHWFGQERFPEYLVKYDRLNQALCKMIKAHDCEQVFWPSSPCGGPGNLSDCWHKDNEGDMHYWDVWANGLPFDAFYTKRPRFCSEFGYQALPSLECIDSFCPERERNVFSSTMMVHQKCKKGNAPIISMFEKLFFMPESLNRFIYLSQLQQAIAIKTAVEFWRSTRPRCMGTLFWQLNDLWPTASWASVEYGGKWKQLQYHARRFYAPVMVAMFRNSEHETKVCAVNDLQEEKRLTVVMSVRNLDGAVFESQSWCIRIGAGQSLELACWNDQEMAKYDVDKVFYEVRATGEGVDFQNVYVRAPYKELEFDKPRITLEVSQKNDAFAVEVVSDKVALYAVLDAPGIRGIFEDNSFLLLPGERKCVGFMPKGNCTLEELRAALTVETL